MRAGPLARLAPEDRARAQRLALSVLRHLEEAHLDPYLRKTPPAAVQLALCLAVVEVFAEGAAALAERLGAELLPTGSLRPSGREQVGELLGYAEGAWWV